MTKCTTMIFALTALLMVGAPAMGAQTSNPFAEEADGIGREKAPPLNGSNPSSSTTVLAEGFRVRADKFVLPKGGLIWRYSHNGNVFAFLIKDPSRTPPYRLLYKKRRQNQLLEIYHAGTYIQVPEWAE